MLDICANMLKTFPELQKTINPTEAFKFVLEQYGYDNFERFKNNDIIKNNDQSSDLPSAWIDKK